MASANLCLAPAGWRRAARRAGALPALAIAVALAIAACAPVAATAAPTTDARDAQGPLDLTEVELVQRDVRMALRIATGASWTAGDLAKRPARSVCLTLVHGEPAIARGRICVTRRASQAALSYVPLAADGTELEPRHLAAAVSRPQPLVLEATFLPAAAGLPVGPYEWWAQTTWIDAVACASVCADRLPDADTVPARVALLGVPRCFGAASRDSRGPCDNTDLRLTVEPPLARARETLDSYCDKRENPGLLAICAFGTVPGEAASTFALVGDSHAATMKTALEVVTLAKRWRGLSIVRASCPATRATPILRTRRRSRQCVTWNRQVLAWLREDREVDTVFLMAHARASVAPSGGRGEFDSARAGYRDEIRALLGVVRRVVVIRDTPSSPPGHLRCVARALEAGRPPGPECSHSRGAALRHDALAAAAQELRSAKVLSIDLTRHFCDDERCFAVVGGALVHRDQTHVTPAFSATLGPFILRALEG